jgi:hypothetical protein
LECTEIGEERSLSQCPLRAKSGHLPPLDGTSDEIAHDGRCFSSPASEGKAGGWRLAGNRPINHACHAQLHHRGRDD